MTEMIQELQLMNHLAKLNRKKLPERMLHAKGAGAHGRFQVYMPLADYTKAGFLNDTEKEVPVFVRFSQATGSRGTGDTIRDYRGFTIKFYTEEGNYDLLLSSLPVYFLRKPDKLPQLLSALMPAQDSNLRYAEDFWRFVSETPESVHTVLHLYSDKGTIKSYRKMEGFSVVPYVWTNRAEEKFLVKYYVKPLLGRATITRQEAEFLRGFDPDAAARDLYESFEQGDATEYEVCVQIMPYEKQAQLSFCPLDAANVWPVSEFPMVAIGKLTLDRGPHDYFEEVEKSAFNPSNLVPGIQLSFDPMLKVLAYTCSDAQRYRLGADHDSIQINRIGENVKSREFTEIFPGEVDAHTIKSLSLNKFDDFAQAGEFFRQLSPKDQNHLVDNIVDDLMFVKDSVQEKVVSYLIKADAGLGKRIAKGLAF